MDYDGDGDLDVLTGSYTGELYLFEGLGDGKLAQGRYLTTASGALLQCNYSVTPEVVDLDADGDLDLVIGTRSSGVFAVENVGTRQAPRWADEQRQLTTAGGAKVMGSNAHHADWDGDGVRDLVLGSEHGEVAWHRNVGTNDRPRYDERQVLVAKGGYDRPAEGSEPTRPGSRTKVHVTDYDGDGKPDLLVGGVQWHTRTLPPLTAEQEAEKKALEPEYEAVKTAYYEVVEERNSYVGKPGGIPQEVQGRMQAARAKLQPLQAKMSAFRREKSVTHGYVWLFRRR